MRATQGNAPFHERRHEIGPADPLRLDAPLPPEPYERYAIRFYHPGVQAVGQLGIVYGLRDRASCCGGDRESIARIGGVDHGVEHGDKRGCIVGYALEVYLPGLMY